MAPRGVSLGAKLGAEVLRSRHVRDASPAPWVRRGRDLLGRREEPVHGSISLGYGPDGKRIRRKVSGKTKQEVRAKLQALHQELNSGVKSSRTYTVREAVDDWLREGLDGTSDRTRTLYEGLLGPVLDAIGARPLRVLSAGDVRSALSQLATRYSTRSLQITRNSLERAIRHAESNDLVGRNVAALVKAPQGRSGRRSKSFTLDQAKALLAASEGTRLHAYVVLSLLVGIRTEEARALRWDHVVTWADDSAGWQPVISAGFDPSRAGEDRFAIYVWRSEREGGDTEDREIPEDPGAAAALCGGAAPAAGTARARPADGR